MKYIGNILTDLQFANQELYNVVKTKEDIIEDIPTLVIGWDKVNKNYDNISLLDWKIDNMTYWTFGRRERGERYEEDIERFNKLALKTLKKNVKYVFFNILIENDERKEDFFKFLKDNTEKTCYIDNNIAYFCKDNNKNVIGISLNDIEYEGKDKNRFLSNIYSNSNIHLVKSNNDIVLKIKYQLLNEPYLIPYLFSN